MNKRNNMTPSVINAAMAPLGIPRCEVGVVVDPGVDAPPVESGLDALEDDPEFQLGDVTVPVPAGAGLLLEIKPVTAVESVVIVADVTTAPP